jgi:hypothetical protein
LISCFRHRRTPWADFLEEPPLLGVGKNRSDFHIVAARPNQDQTSPTAAPGFVGEPSAQLCPKVVCEKNYTGGIQEYVVTPSTAVSMIAPCVESD